jgi:hypothetical protein
MLDRNDTGSSQKAVTELACKTTGKIAVNMGEIFLLSNCSTKYTKKRKFSHSANFKITAS